MTEKNYVPQFMSVSSIQSVRALTTSLTVFRYYLSGFIKRVYNVTTYARVRSGSFLSKRIWYILYVFRQMSVLDDDSLLTPPKRRKSTKIEVVENEPISPRIRKKSFANKFD